MKKITSKKLLNYGAMSAAILGAADVTGQIVYTDLDPDQSLATGDAFPIDINDDGTDDFSIDIFDAAGGPGAVVFPGINGSTNSNGFVGFNSGNYNYPSLLQQDAVIDGTTPSFTSARGDLNFYGCAYTNSQWCDTVTDGFLGLVFQLAGNTHYGWVRMDVSADASSIVVKDYAFNSTPDEQILAGQTVILGVESQAFNGFTYFVDNTNTLNLKANSAMESVAIHNILGQEVISQKLGSTNEIVNLSALKSGVYLATISIDGAKKTVKVAKK